MSNHYGSFTYYSNDLDNMSANLKDLNFTITAVGEKSGIMTNYQNPQATYYANDINITPTLSIPNSPNYDPKPTIQTNLNTNFTSGVAMVTQSNIDFNFDRNHSKPINRQTIQGNTANFGIDVIEADADDINGSKPTSFAGNATFLYGRFRVSDVKTSDINTNIKVIHEIYSTLPMTGPYSTMKQNSASWYINRFITTELNSENYKPRSNRRLDSTDYSSNTNIIIPPFPNNYIRNGKATLGVTTSSTKSFKAYYHINIPTWLWYSKYEDYSFIANATCASHPCFEYIFQTENSDKGIKSGDFKGTKFENDFKSKRRKAIKMMR
jgi:hypothetical protein